MEKARLLTIRVYPDTFERLKAISGGKGHIKLARLLIEQGIEAHTQSNDQNQKTAA
jgi:hypothetical protein